MNELKIYKILTRRVCVISTFIVYIYIKCMYRVFVYEILIEQRIYFTKPAAKATKALLNNKGT